MKHAADHSTYVGARCVRGRQSGQDLGMCRENVARFRCVGEHLHGEGALKDLLVDVGCEVRNIDDGVMPAGDGKHRTDTGRSR